MSPRGDHRGCVWKPPEVIWRTLAPSASITKMCGTPPRSETNAISRPFGDHVGSVSMPAWRVRRRLVPPAGLRPEVSGGPSFLGVLARVLPAGPDDAGALW